MLSRRQRRQKGAQHAFDTRRVALGERDLKIVEMRDSFKYTLICPNA